MDFLLSKPTALVHLASLLYVIAFLVRDQLLLRVLVLVATALYIGYYYFVPEMPLWDAILWSLVLGAANLFVTAQIILERTTFNLDEERKTLFEDIGTLTPGEFRRLMKIAVWRTCEEEVQLTREGEPLGTLFYVLRGDVLIEKEGKAFQIPPKCFVGEVAYFLGDNASANARLAAKARYVSWGHEDLRRLTQKHPGIRVALHTALNGDMATKVARSHGRVIDA